MKEGKMNMPKQIDPEKALFSIGAVADILGIKPRILRIYEEKGLIFPHRSDTNRRLYSLRDIDILAYIRYLTSIKKVNAAGVLEIQKILSKMIDRTRNAFMEEIEKEIEALPQDKKKIFMEDHEDLEKHENGKTEPNIIKTEKAVNSEKLAAIH
jgi:DNA-binding transcriptional MerR regulator